MTVVATTAEPAGRGAEGRGNFGVRALFYYLLFLGISAVSGGMIWAYLIFWVPSFREIFKDFKTTLPAATEWLLDLSGWVSEPVGAVVMLVVLGLIPVLPAFLVALPRERWKRVGSAILVSLIFLVGGMIAFMCMQFILQLPLTKLVQSVSGGAEGGG